MNAPAKHPGGRPLKFGDLEALKNQIETYFEECAQSETIPTVTGLALSLETTRRTLLDYQVKDEYAHAIKMAKVRIEAGIEQHLLRGRNAAGAIFNLKNNFGWKDQVEHVGGSFSLELNISFDAPRVIEHEDTGLPEGITFESPTETRS